MIGISMRSVRVSFLVGATLLSGLAVAATGEEHPSGGSKFFITLGGYLLTVDQSATASSPDGLGTTVDLEGLLGLDDDRNLARIDGYWRFKPRHRLDFTYYYLNRTGERAVSESFDWDGVRYDANAQINSDFTNQYVKLTYRFAFLNDERIEVGLSGGLATFVFDGTLEGTGTVLVDGVPTGSTSFQRSSRSVVAPIPNAGLYGEFRILPKLVLRQSIDYFSLSMDNWKGRYAELRIGMDWRFTEHFGFGLGWDQTALKYESSEDRSVEVLSDLSGLVWYFSYSF